MDPLVIAIMLLLAGLVLLAAEAVLPSHGLLGAMCAACMIGGLYYCFLAGPWLGVITLLIMVVSSPFVFMGMMAIWPKTPVGKRLVLNATVPAVAPAGRMEIGAQGRTVTELRPIGECDFGEVRTEVISEYGIIEPGSMVKVVALDADGRPVVKQLTQENAKQA